MSTVIEERVPMYEYDRDLPRDRAWYWKRGLLVTTFLAGALFVADLVPLIQPVITHTHHRISEL
jgi:hypothetical protein